MWAPSGPIIRMFVGRESEVPGGHPREEFFDQIAYTSLNDADEPVRDFAGTSIPAWSSTEVIADQLLAALPLVNAAADDPDYVCRLAALLEASRASGEFPRTEE